jgi:hypothetical protein
MRRTYRRYVAASFLSVVAACVAGSLLSAQASIPAQARPTPDELLTALRDVNPQTRQDAAQRLGVAGGDRAVQALVAVLADKEHLVRKAAAEALGAIADPAAADPLIAAFRDANTDVQNAAAAAVGRLGPGVIDRLLRETGHERDYARRGAARALGDIGDRRAVDPLVVLLGDKSTIVRMAAVSALAKLNEASSVPVVSKLLADSDPTLVSYTARALAGWKDVQAEGALDAELTRTPVNLAAVAGAYQYYIRKAEPTGCRDRCAIQRPLIDALIAHGIEPMAQDFFYCRNEPLRVAARVWAQNRGEAPASWPGRQCADGGAAREPAAASDGSDTATVFVVHSGGKSIDVDVGNSYHGVVADRSYLRERVRPGSIKIQARVVDGYAQKFRYNVVIGQSADKSPTFTHSGALDTLYQPSGHSRSDHFWLDLKEASIFPYVRSGGVEGPPTTVISAADALVEAGQTYYFNVQEKDKRVQIQPTPAGQGKELVDKSRPTGARFFATSALTGIENYLPAGEMTTMQVTPVCASFRIEPFRADCSFWRLLRGEKQVKTLRD